MTGLIDFDESSWKEITTDKKITRGSLVKFAKEIASFLVGNGYEGRNAALATAIEYGETEFLGKYRGLTDFYEAFMLTKNEIGSLYEVCKLYGFKLNKDFLKYDTYIALKAYSNLVNKKK